MPPIYAGQTFRVTISDLADAAGVPLVNPSVAIALLTPDAGTSAGVVTRAGATWWAEFTPAAAGRHVITAEAVAGGTVWKSEATLYIHPEAQA